MTAGQLVRLREHLGLTVPDFARLIGVNHTAVYKWENGKRTVRSRRVKLLLEDLWERNFGAPWDRERARIEVAKRLGVDLDAAGQKLVEYGRLHREESWEDVVARVVDGERYLLGRSAATA